MYLYMVSALVPLSKICLNWASKAYKWTLLYYRAKFYRSILN